MKKLFILLFVILASCSKEVDTDDRCECVEQIQRRGNTAPQNWHDEGVRNTLILDCDRDGDIRKEWKETKYAKTTYYRIIFKCN